jgi:hypothetical protein
MESEKNGNQHQGDEKIACNRAQDKLEIVELVVPHIAWYRNQGNGGYSGSNHAKGNQKPNGLTVAIKVGSVPGMPGSESGNQHEQEEVGQYDA